MLRVFFCWKPFKNWKKALEIFNTYATILQDIFPETWISKVQLWRERIASTDIQNQLEALDICEINAFPNLHQVLRLMAALLVTTATNERFFWTLR